MAFVTLIAACRLDVSIEADNENKDDNLTFMDHINSLWESLRISELRNTILFVMGAKLLNPKFGTFSYYFITEVLHIS